MGEGIDVMIEIRKTGTGKGAVRICYIRNACEFMKE